MTPFDEAARALLAAQPGEGTTSKDVAGRAARVGERLTRHLARLVGETGVATLFRRSVALASVRFPWLSPPGSETDGSVYSVLCAALETQDPEVATEAFLAVLSTFVGLLKRLIGEGLVDRLLGEVWPAIYPPAVKETS